ncbi:MAG: ATP-binding protein [Pseudomonadota bacterium]
MGDSNSMAKNVRIGGATPVSDAADTTRAFAIKNRIVGADLSRLCVIVEEIFANLIEHGGVGPYDMVDLSLSSDPDGVRIVIVDPGQPFDPRSVRPAHRLPDRGGGAGINIVHAWASHIDYRPSAGRNQLTLLIPLRGDGQ